MVLAPPIRDYTDSVYPNDPAETPKPRKEPLKPSLITSRWWMDIVPTEWQAACLSLWDVEEVFVGGAAGPGKSMYMLLDAVQFADHPGSKSLLLRNTIQDLTLEGGLLDTAKNLWKDKPGIRYNDRDRRFTFPPGSTVTFGYLEDEDDHLRYRGSEYTMIGYDEASMLNPDSMIYLASRQRRVGENPVPIRRRYASNPGGVAHEWIRETYIKSGNTRDRIFVPGFAQDNPHLDAEDYHHRLEGLQPVEVAQLRDGDWDITDTTGHFEVDKIHPFEFSPPTNGARIVRYWDLASSKRLRRSHDPDWTVGIKYMKRKGEYYVLDVVRVRKGVGQVTNIIRSTAEFDGVNVPVRIEEEPGSSGKYAVIGLARNELEGFDVRGIKSTGEKLARARPVMSVVANGLLHVQQAPWTFAFLAELRGAGGGGHDDQIDSLSGGHRFLTSGRGGNWFIEDQEAA